MAILAAFLVFIPLLMIQIGILANLPLIQGYPDLILITILAWSLRREVRTAWHWALIGALLVTWVSAMPFGVYLLAYTSVVGLALLVRRMVWRIPFLSMLVMTIIGTFVTDSISQLALQLSGRPFVIEYTFAAIFLPSVLYNFLFAIPIYALIGELARWLYPLEPLYES